ncbi:MAG: hypothetical protein RL701_6025 [Pseudomonadota bacterium]|jgi:hypothetical protein
MLVGKHRRTAALIGGLSFTVWGGVWAWLAPVPSHAASADLVDPKALAALARSTSYLRSLPAFRVHAEVAQDEVVHDDFKLQRSLQVAASVRRPDRMRAELTGDLGARLFVYDGKKLSLALKDEQYYVTLPAPPTLRETLDVALDKHAIELPLLDIIYVAMGGDIHKHVSDAAEIGLSSVDGVNCTQLAFRGKQVDWQLWIEQGTKPVPRQIVITTKDDPTHPQYSARLRWEVSPLLSDDTFAFVPAAGALPIALGPMPATKAATVHKSTQSK